MVTLEQARRPSSHAWHCRHCPTPSACSSPPPGETPARASSRRPRASDAAHLRSGLATMPSPRRASASMTSCSWPSCTAIPGRAAKPPPAERSSCGTSRLVAAPPSSQLAGHRSRGVGARGLAGRRVRAHRDRQQAQERPANLDQAESVSRSSRSSTPRWLRRARVSRSDRSASGCAWGGWLVGMCRQKPHPVSAAAPPAGCPAGAVGRR